ncbi:MAG: hypothetical protein ACE5G0_15155 [Rhodothermales bacterium]
MQAQRYTLPAPEWIRLKTWLPSLLLLPVCIHFLLRHGDDPVFNVLNLLIHEAGHLWFFIFGDFFHAAGGTLMQVLLPAALILHFRRYRVRLGMQIAFLWLGQNFLDISVYAADARSLQLVLLGNRKHDWVYLLNRFGWLEYDQAFAFGFCFLAMLSFIALLVLPAYWAHER